MYKIRLHKDGYELYNSVTGLGLFTFADIIEALTAARAANREIRK